MKCPECNAWTEVLWTTLLDGCRRRRYQCANLHRFSTEERVKELKRGGWTHDAKQMQRGQRGRFTGLSSTAIEKEDALSMLPRVNPRIDKLLK